MIRLRQYKASDAKTIVGWCKTEEDFRKWTSDRYDKFPITSEDMNKKYLENNGDCSEPDNFYPFTAVDDDKIVGHLVMRYVDEEKSVIRFGFVIVDDSKRGKGYGKQMIQLAIKYALEIYKAKKVTLGVFENNPAAFYCYKAAGFVEQPEKNFEVEIFGEKWKILEMEVCWKNLI